MKITRSADAFIRRFFLHVLPPRFAKIRYFGFLFHRDKRKNIILIRIFINAKAEYAESSSESVQPIMLRLTGVDIGGCPQCGKGRMVVVMKIPKGSRMRNPKPL